MRLTTRGRFAVTAMLDIATHQTGEPVTLSEISERQSISLSYLEQLFGRLRRRGLVASVRGPGGGYRLAHAASDITVADIVFAVDETLDATECGGRANCQDGQRCSTHGLWTALNQCVENFLRSITLEQLARDPAPVSQEIPIRGPRPGERIGTVNV
jgi:Rrf2 family transcriptional regulator, iron-sulfur cluster assembly transcription factor